MSIERNLNAAVIIILSGVLLAGFGVQVFLHERPCPLCFLQRIGMIGVGISLFLNVWFGVRPAHYGLAILCALTGGFVALRQISLHVCPGFSAFGLPVLGLSLYTWSFIVFACSVLAIGLLLFLYIPKRSEELPRRFSFLDKTACGLLFFVSFGNIIAALLQCSLGACSD